MAGHRNKRLQEEIRRDVSFIISTKVKDPAIREKIVVTGVDLTNDLSYAKIYISTGGNPELLDSLKKAAGFIRKELSQKMTTRITPELLFEKDESLEYGAKIEKILADLNKESKKNEENSWDNKKSRKSINNISQRSGWW